MTVLRMKYKAIQSDINMKRLSTMEFENTVTHWCRWTIFEASKGKKNAIMHLKPKLL